MSAEHEEPKIVVDEDWKSRVQAERESAAKQAGHTDSTSEEKPEGAAGGQLPAASFELLLSTLAAQALTAMGKLPDPAQGHAVVRPTWPSTTSICSPCSSKKRKATSRKWKRTCWKTSCINSAWHS